jgi:hypothetical protein
MREETIRAWFDGDFAFITLSTGGSMPTRFCTTAGVRIDADGTQRGESQLERRGWASKAPKNVPIRGFGAG